MVIVDAELAKSARKFDNMDWLLAGYNLMRGNPFSRGADPGLTINRQIFRADYDGNRVTADGKYRVPDRMYIRKRLDCEVSFGADNTKTSLELSHKFETKTKAGGGADFGAFKAKFTASAGFKASSKMMAESETSETYTDAQCIVYAGGVDEIKPRFTEGFLYALEHLPESYQGNERQWKSFLDRFGTHYVDQGQMGARFGRRSVITKKTLETMAERKTITNLRNSSMKTMQARIKAVETTRFRIIPHI